MSASPIVQVIHPKEKDLGEFSVRRSIPNVRQKMIGPWIFFDHFGPAEFAAGEGMNVRPHPHINLATVTYLFEGEIRHRDSLGTDLTITPGAINLMVAGEGITHSERVSEGAHESAYRMEGLQLWHALPEADEEMPAEFHHYTADDIPETEGNGAKIRVMMGEAYGLTSPVKTFAPTLYFEVDMADAQLAMPTTYAELGLYALEGDLSVGGQALERFSMTVLDVNAAPIVTGTGRFAVIGGDPLGKRYIDWNFVSSRKNRIVTAMRDWHEERFPTVPGDVDERIPLPEHTRVAMYP